MSSSCLTFPQLMSKKNQIRKKGKGGQGAGLWGIVPFNSLAGEG